MKSKKLIALFGSICLMLALAVLPFLTACAKPAPAALIELKLNESYTAKDPMTTEAYEVWAKKVEEATNGRVKVTVFPGETLSKSKEAYDSALAGVCDIAMVPILYLAERFPLSDSMNLPVFCPTATAASRVAWELYEKLSEMKAEYSQAKLLFFYCTTPYQIHTAKKPVYTLNDLKGLQIRAAGAIDAAMMKALGATPVNITMPEAYLALEKGVLDGLLSPFGPMVAFKTADVTNYHVENADLKSNIFAVVMNLDKWNGLPPDIRKAIDKVSGVAAAELFGTVFDGTDAPSVQYMKQKGHTFITLSPEEKARWVEAIMPLRDKWVSDMAAKGLPGDKVLKEILRLVEKHSK